MNDYQLPKMREGTGEPLPHEKISQSEIWWLVCAIAFVLLVVLLISASGCKKDNNNNDTQTGKYVMFFPVSDCNVCISNAGINGPVIHLTQRYFFWQEITENSCLITDGQGKYNLIDHKTIIEDGNVVDFVCWPVEEVGTWN